MCVCMCVYICACCMCVCVSIFAIWHGSMMEDLTITNLVYSLFKLQPYLNNIFYVWTYLVICICVNVYYFTTVAMALYKMLNGCPNLFPTHAHTHTHTHTYTHTFKYYTCALNYVYKSTTYIPIHPILQLEIIVDCAYNALYSKGKYTGSGRVGRVG